MDNIQLKEIIEEILAEIENEVSLDERNKENKAKKDAALVAKGSDRMHKTGGANSLLSKMSIDPRNKGLVRSWGKDNREDPLQKSSSAAKERDTFTGRTGSKLSSIKLQPKPKLPGDGPKVKNPETGQEILATTAYKAGPQHPAYAAAKSALKKEIVSRMNESSGFIRMKDLLNESMAERRINLVRVQTIMEKLYPELTDTQSKKLMEICTEVHMMASQLNMTPYIRTESSLVEWSLLVTGFRTKLQELKEEVTKVCEDKKINPATVVKAIDEVLSY